MEPTLGQEIRRFRTDAGVTLRKFAENLKISAAYLSDIEHDRRRPPDELLGRISSALRAVGASYDTLRRLDTRLEPDLRLWANSTPGVREMLRKFRETGRDPREVLRHLEDAERKKRKRER